MPLPAGRCAPDPCGPVATWPGVWAGARAVPGFPVGPPLRVAGAVPGPFVGPRGVGPRVPLPAPLGLGGAVVRVILSLAILV